MSASDPQMLTENGQGSGGGFAPETSQFAKVSKVCI
jgi:hypothetical protein